MFSQGTSVHLKMEKIHFYAVFVIKCLEWWFIDTDGDTYWRETIQVWSLVELISSIGPTWHMPGKQTNKHAYDTVATFFNGTSAQPWFNSA